MYYTLCYPRQDALRAATPFSHPSVVTDQSTRSRGFRPPSGERTTLTKSHVFGFDGGRRQGVEVRVVSVPPSISSDQEPRIISARIKGGVLHEAWTPPSHADCTIDIRTPGKKVVVGRLTRKCSALAFKGHQMKRKNERTARGIKTCTNCIEAKRNSTGGRMEGCN